MAIISLAICSLRKRLWARRRNLCPQSPDRTLWNLANSVKPSLDALAASSHLHHCWNWRATKLNATSIYRDTTCECSASSFWMLSLTRWDLAQAQHGATLNLRCRQFFAQQSRLLQRKPNGALSESFSTRY